MVWVKAGISSKLNNVIPEWVFQLVNDPTLGDFFMLSLPIATVERIVFTIIAIIVGVAVIRTIGRTHLGLFGRLRSEKKEEK